MGSTATSLQPDLAIARRHLELLGYEPEESVYLREFAGKGLKATAAKSTVTTDTLPAAQASDRGVYFVVNGQGQRKEDIQSGRALFAEFDDRPLEDQLQAILTSGLPEPSCQVATRHSVHTYWRCSEAIPVDMWEELQLDLIHHLGSDPTIKDPSRVMRLAGFYHVQSGEEPLQCELVSDGGHTYSYLQLRQAIHRRPVEILGNDSPVTQAQPLPKKIVDGSRQLSDILHQDILPRLNPEALFNWPGHRFTWSGDGKARGHCPWHESQSGTAFHIEPNGQGGEWLWHCPSCDRGGNAVDYRHQLAGGSGAPKGKDFVAIAKELAQEAAVELPDKPSYADSHRYRETVTGDPLVTHVVTGSNPYGASIIGETVTGDRLSDGVEDLVTTHDWDALKAAIGNDSFNPFQVLPAPLMEMACGDAARLNIDPLALWQYLLPAALSLMGRETRLDMSGWLVPNIIWSMLVQESGTGKSRAKDIITAPLQRWDVLEHERFTQEWGDFQAQAKAKSKSDDDGPQPDKPTRRKYVFNVATPQGLVRRLADQEDNGVLWCRDELKGLFNSLDQFTGQGEGLEILLETWDGKPASVDRVDVENSYIVPESRLSVCGGIQPGVIERTFDVEDSQGVLARFLVASPKELPVKRVKGHAALAEHLPLLYGFIQNTDWGTIAPTLEADDLFTELVEAFGNERPPIPAAKAWLRKLAGQTARIAIAIHAIECYYNRAKDIHILTRDTLERARWMAQQYKNHFYHLIGVTASNGLSGVLAQIQEMASAYPEGIAIRALYQGIKKIRTYAKLEAIPIASYTQKLCEELAAMGYGQVSQVGKSKIYTPSGNLPPVQSRSPVTDSPESFGASRFEPVTDMVTDRSPVTVSTAGDAKQERELKKSLNKEAPKTPVGEKESQAAPPRVDPPGRILGNSTPANNVQTLPKKTADPVAVVYDVIPLDEVEWLEDPEEETHG